MERSNGIPTDAGTYPVSRALKARADAFLTDSVMPRDAYGLERLPTSVPSLASGILLSCCEYYEDTLQKGIQNGQKWCYSNSSDYVPQATSFDRMVASGRYGANCAMLSNWALMDMGAMPEGARFWGAKDATVARFDTVGQYLLDCGYLYDLRQAENRDGRTFSALYENGCAVPGDVFLCSGHVFIYRGGETFFAAGHDTRWHSDGVRYTDDTLGAVFDSFVTDFSCSANYRYEINWILRLKPDYRPARYRDRNGELRFLNREP